jgi:glycerol-3-phosphate acyltransferase PlsY
MERIICVAIGYLFGLLQTGYLYGKTQHVDIRKEGSGNAGTTNALRTMGWKAGAITFLGDCFKCVLAVAATYFIYGKTQADIWPLLMMYTGAGVILGHNFPFYMNFKGGKGIAVMAGLVVINSGWHMPKSILLLLVTALFFLIPVIVTRYISVGSLCAYTAFLIEMILFGQWGWFDMETGYCYELYGLVFLLTVLAWYRHRENIKRLIKGTENKFGSKRKGH